MIERSRVLLRRPGIRYLIVGGSVYIFELLVIVIAQQLGASPVWAVTISYGTGTTLAFLLQKLVTFSDKRLHHKILIPQLIATCLLIGWNLVFTVLVTKLLEHHLPAVLTRTVALAITVIWNFYIYKTRIFKTGDNPVY
jgi:putative flippase GtrA